MKILSEQKALDRLGRLKSDFKSEIAANFEHRAKSCITCETQGDYCPDAHFVNVHISRLALNGWGDTLPKLPYACPLFEKGTG